MDYEEGDEINWRCSICGEDFPGPENVYADVVQHKRDEHGIEPHPFDEHLVNRGGS